MNATITPLILDQPVLALIISIVLGLFAAVLVFAAAAALSKRRNLSDLLLPAATSVIALSLLLLLAGSTLQNWNDRESVVSWAETQYGYELSGKQARLLLDGRTVFLPDGAGLAASFTPEGLLLVERP